MLFGIWLSAVGYAIFYWGIHHFKGVDCNSDQGCRISLIDALGIPVGWKIPKGQPFQLGTPTGPITSQQQNANNATTPNPLTGNDGAWTGMLLKALNADGANTAKLLAWNACEGNLQGHSGLGINNPFNTTLVCCNSLGAVNSAGVQNYPTITDGINATVQTLQAKRYAAIVDNLQKNGSFGAFANAVGSSGWGTSGACINSKGAQP